MRDLVGKTLGLPVECQLIPPVDVRRITLAIYYSTVAHAEALDEIASPGTKVVGFISVGDHVSSAYYCIIVAARRYICVGSVESRVALPRLLHL